MNHWPYSPTVAEETVDHDTSCRSSGVWQVVVNDQWLAGLQIHKYTCSMAQCHQENYIHCDCHILLLQVNISWRHAVSVEELKELLHTHEDDAETVANDVDG